MRVDVLLIILALLAVGYLLVCGRGFVENFFYGNNTITVNWTAITGAASYNWKVCSASTCDPNPDNWPGQPQNSTTNSAILNSTTCPGCDFGSSIQFAVQTIGTNGLNSAWTMITLDLQSYLRVNQQRIISSSTNPVPPKAGDTSSVYQLAFSGNPIPMGTYEKNFAYVTLTRGSTVYHYNTPVLYTPIPNNFYAVYTNIDYTSANTNWNSPIPGGVLAAGDIITVASFFANVGVSGPTWPPPNTNGPVYYSGSYQVTAQAPPAAPATLTWQIN